MSAATPHGTTPHYFIPSPSRYPVSVAAGLLLMILGGSQWVNGHEWGAWCLLTGMVVWLATLAQWFGTAIGESEGGLYSDHVDVSFRWSMSWFIFSEVMFFGAFFTALWWARTHALRANHRAQAVRFMIVTVLLGALFLGVQGYEYHHLYTELNLKLSSGAYGSTFFMLTGFHGLHVFIGMLMLLFITLRLRSGHFTPDRHFGFEGAAWYWHFVDVVWLGLFVFVYVL